jgi:hypothetical protein
MRYLFLIIFLLCLFILGAQFQSAMKVWIDEGASGLYLLAFLSPALIPTIIFAAITIWLYKRHTKKT